MNDNVKSLILAVVLVGLIASGLWVLYEESNRIATKSQDAVTYSRYENASMNTSELEYLARNLALRIPENTTQNVTIWKGDKLIAYIPRGA